MTEPKITDAPAVIHLVYGEINQDAKHSECSEVTWSQIPMYNSDVKYIRVDIAESLYKALADLSYYFAYTDIPSGLGEFVNNALNSYGELDR